MKKQKIMATENKLHQAIRERKLEKVKELIAADPDSIKKQHSELGTLPIVCAARYGNLEAFKLLFDEKLRPKPTDVVDKNGIPLICHACAGGNRKIVELLLDAGFSLDAKTATGLSVMHFAAKAGIKMLKFLGGKGLDCNVKAINGWTPLHSAAEVDKLDVMNYLNKKGLSNDLLLMTENGKTSWIGGKKVQEFLQREANAKASASLKNATAPSFNTAIMPHLMMPFPNPETNMAQVDGFKKQIVELATRVAHLEQNKAGQATLIANQQREIEQLKKENQQFKSQLLQQQTNIAAPKAVPLQKTSWTPNFDLRSVTVKPEPETKDFHSGDKRTIDDNAKMSSSKRHK